MKIPAILFICMLNLQSVLVYSYAVEEDYTLIDSVEEKIMDKSTGAALISTGKVQLNAKTGEKLKIGKWVNKMKSGALMSEENYNAKGILDGIQVKYGMDGKIQYKWSLVNRLKNGIFTTYFPSSEIVAIEAKYKDDELDGESIFYNKDGTIKDRKIYKEGEQVEK